MLYMKVHTLRTRFEFEASRVDEKEIKRMKECVRVRSYDRSTDAIRLLFCFVLLIPLNCFGCWPRHALERRHCTIAQALEFIIVHRPRFIHSMKWHPIFCLLKAARCLINAIIILKWPTADRIQNKLLGFAAS